MTRPIWLESFTTRFGLYDNKATPIVENMKDTTEDFRERVVEALKDLAKQEREANRSKFDLTSRIRADAFDRAADLVLFTARQPHAQR